MVLKIKVHFRFCHQLLLKLSRVRVKRNKNATFHFNSMDLKIAFHVTIT